MNDNSDNLFWIDFAQDLSALREKEKSRLPYNFNIIDELHAYENAHTRLLLKILSYNKNREYPYLRSFLKMVDNRCDSGFPVDKVSNPIIKFNSENIDGLIEDGTGAYSIIIENKINFAADQEKQIERYYTTVRSHGIEDCNIYVIYLTLDGNKKVSSFSLPETLEKELGKRFINMNYRDDILPWLRQDVLPEIKITETLFESGILQYIDHLEGRLCMRESEQPIRNAMNNAIKEKLGMDKLSVSEQWKNLSEKVESVGVLLRDLENFKGEISNGVISDWDSITRKYLPDNDVNNAIKSGGFYQLPFKNIDDNTHFEWYPLDEDMLFADKAKNYSMDLHVENDPKGIIMDRVRRNQYFISKAQECGYEPQFKNAVAISKQYRPLRPFAELSEPERCNFLDKAYKDVKYLMEVYEGTYSLLQDEDKYIEDLISSMKGKTGGYSWIRWNWLITTFNDSTHKIGIEGCFNVREDKKIEFLSWITVRNKCDWGIYKADIKEKFQPENDEVIEGARTCLYLPAIEIGSDFASCWDSKKDVVTNSLKKTFDDMKSITDEVGK